MCEEEDVQSIGLQRPGAPVSQAAVYCGSAAGCEASLCRPRGLCFQNCLLSDLGFEPERNHKLCTCKRVLTVSFRE